MQGVFKKGDVVTSVNSNQPIKILELLGAGGQGEVYRVDYSGQTLALKWYFDHTATDSQKLGIVKLIDDGPPGVHFLWPTELVRAEGSPSFGYLMPLREDRFKSFTDVVNGRIDPKFSILITIGRNLVDSF